MRISEIEIETDPDDVVDGEEPVRDEKNPTPDKIAVHHESDRGCKLADKQPL